MIPSKNRTTRESGSGLRLWLLLGVAFLAVDGVLPGRVGAAVATPTPDCCAIATQSTPMAIAASVGAWGVVTDESRGWVYVSDANNEVRVFNMATGALVKEITGLGQVTGLCLGPSPNRYLFAALRTTKEVVWFDPGAGGSGVVPVVTLGARFLGLAFQGLWVDSSGAVYVTEDGGTNVRVFDFATPAPTPQALLVPVAVLGGLTGPNGMWKVGGDLYVADSGNFQVVKFVATPASTFGFSGPTPVATFAGVPTGIGQDPAGNFYVSLANGYEIYEPTPTSGNWGFGSSCQRAELEGAQGIAVDGTGNVYVAAGGAIPPVLVKMNACPKYQPTPTPDITDQTQAFIYPSPVRGDRASVSYLMPEAGQLTITVWNENAEKVLVIGDSKPAGVQSATLNLGGYPSGVYYYQLTFALDGNRKIQTKLQKFVHIR